MSMKSVAKKWLLGAAVVVAESVMASEQISVLQLNIWQEGTVVAGGFEAIVDEIARLQPDFVTLSEVRNYRDTRFCDRITAALAAKGLEYYSFYSEDSGLLSRYEITDSATVFPLRNDHGSVYRLDAEVKGRKVRVFTGHLDYLNDTYYEVRGYDGNNWRRMEAPLTDVATIMERNALSMRDEAVRSVIADSREAMEEGALVFFGGDFNEPSHLDWTEATRDMADHNGVVIDWPVTRMLHDAGFRDAYRALYPDPVTHPGYTYPADNADVAVGRLTWAPLADERERIDYVFYYPREGLRVVEASITGPKGCIVRSERVADAGSDNHILPLGAWPSDHKGVFVRFELTSSGL